MAKKWKSGCHMGTHYGRVERDSYVSDGEENAMFVGMECCWCYSSVRFLVILQCSGMWSVILGTSKSDHSSSILVLMISHRGCMKL